jgi:hypothetical protein
MRRWVCPNGCPGVHAPDKPRADDVRRYCLPCSEASGRLVRRTWTQRNMEVLLGVIVSNGASTFGALAKGNPA